MMFLNWLMLIGLAAIAIPIIIHLLNRQRATIVDWGAMRFLMESLTSRKRRILIEEIILMCLRCLAVALLAMALARPFLPAHTSIPWALVLPAALVAVMLVGVAGAMWSERRTRWMLLGIAALLILIAGSASLAEYWSQGKKWSLAGGERDVAIVIDGSASMMIPVDGRTNFDRALEEARGVVDACKPADTVSLIVAGAVPRPYITNPTVDRNEISETMAKVAAVGGSMRIVDSLVAATDSMAQGNNPAKKIVVLTDGQGIGWETRNEARWQFVENGMRPFAIPPQVIYRAYSLPKTLKNAAIGDIRFSRRIIGTNWPVHVDVAVVNSGTVQLPPTAVDLFVDGAPQGHQESGDIRVGASETLRFMCTFALPGPHIVTAKITADDEMTSDNTASRVVEIVGKLPVLLVDGNPSLRGISGAADCLEIALAPKDQDETAPPAPRAVNPPAGHMELLVEPKKVAGPEIQTIKDFSAFKVVVLANMPRLPQATAQALQRFVAEGGGLLIAPGDKVVPKFYQEWVTDTGEPFTPALLTKRRVIPDTPARLGLKTFSHPALDLISDTTQSDADKVAIKAYWVLDADQRDRNIRVGGYLDTGDPFLVERKVGKGYVLMTAMSLDMQDSNWPMPVCRGSWVPLVHELAYYLAAPALMQANVRPGTEFAVELPLKTPAGDGKKGSGAALLLEGQVQVLTPSNGVAEATIDDTPRGAKIGFKGTFEPGLYYLVVSPAAAERFIMPGQTAKGIPFVVTDDADEGHLVPLTDAELDAVGQHVNLFRVSDMEQLRTAIVEQVPGEELWKYLAMALLAALMAEIGLTRWIAAKRRIHTVETVSFGPSAVDVQTFREKARRLLAVSKEDSEPASKT